MYWIADYGDKCLPQYNDDDTENKYTDIDRDRLTRFLLVDELGSIRVVLNLTPDKKLIYRRRVAMSVFTKTRKVVYILGWQQNINNNNVQFLNFYFEDGHIETTDGFKEDHQWYYPVVFLPEEEL